MILAGDVGGTKVQLALFERSASGLKLVHERRFDSQTHSGLDQILEDFLGTRSDALECAGFGVAGPVRGGQCEVTHLPWVLNERALADFLKLKRVRLLNDLAAMALSAPFLTPDDFHILQPGRVQEHGRIAVMAAGTGFGCACLMHDGGEGHQIMDSEAGQADFAARTDEEIELFRYLAARFERISIEHVLSGRGIDHIFRFLVECSGSGELAIIGDKIEQDQPGKAVIELALSGGSPLCMQALEIFVSIYGAVAGNIGLQYLPRGGVVLGGGIAPKIIQILQKGGFMNAFTSKGRFKNLLEQIPVKVIVNPHASLIGAARFALGEASIVP
jgi:glucokinase